MTYLPTMTTGGLPEDSPANAISQPVVDITPDTSPIMGKTPVEGLFISAGWGTGGYKAIPAGGEAMAWTIANGEPPESILPFALERFTTGALIDEHGAAAVAH